MDRAPGPKRAVLTTHQLVYRFEGGFELRPGRELLRHGSPVAIGGTALELLRLLLAARGDLVTKDELFASLWSDVVVVENTLHQHIGALRRALGEHAELIGTVPRRGYRFTGPVAEAMVDSGPAAEEIGRPPAIPSPLTSLIGRDDELATIERLLRASRCVTLLGAGGIGKTRLALEIAQRRRAAGDPGVFLAELASLGRRGACRCGHRRFARPLGPHRRAAADTHSPGAAPSPGPHRRRQLRAPDRRHGGVAARAPRIVPGAAHPRHQPATPRPAGRAAVPCAGARPAAARDVDPSLLTASSAVRLLLARVADCDARLAFDGEALQIAAELCRQLDATPWRSSWPRRASPRSGWLPSAAGSPIASSSWRGRSAERWPSIRRSIR
jgi:DNA-binding winged helix-turn-helix (wHTH) protein